MDDSIWWWTTRGLPGERAPGLSPPAFATCASKRTRAGRSPSSRTGRSRRRPDRHQHDAINGVEVLRAVKRLSPGTECVMVSALDEAPPGGQLPQEWRLRLPRQARLQEDLVSTVGRAWSTAGSSGSWRSARAGISRGSITRPAFKSIATQSPTCCGCSRGRAARASESRCWSPARPARARN